MIKIQITNEKSDKIEGLLFNGKIKRSFMMVYGFSEKKWRIYICNPIQRNRFIPINKLPCFDNRNDYYKNRKIIRWMGQNFDNIINPNIEVIHEELNHQYVSLVKCIVCNLNGLQTRQLMLNYDIQYCNYWMLYILDKTSWIEVEFPKFNFISYHLGDILGWMQTNYGKLLRLKNKNG